MRVRDRALGSGQEEQATAIRDALWSPGPMLFPASGHRAGVTGIVPSPCSQDRRDAFSSFFIDVRSLPLQSRPLSPYIPEELHQQRDHMRFSCPEGRESGGWGWAGSSPDVQDSGRKVGFPGCGGFPPALGPRRLRFPPGDAGTRLRHRWQHSRSGDTPHPVFSSPWADWKWGQSSGWFLTRGSSDPDLSRCGRGLGPW